MIKLKTKSALSYFGSDSEVAGQLAATLDHCKHVTIPFCGGMSILPHLQARAIVANDLNDLAVNFYRVIGDRCGAGSRDELIRRCQSTLSHPSELEKAVLLLSNPLLQASVIEKAWAYWAMCWIGRKGKGGTRHLGGLPSVRRTANGGNNASRIRAAAEDLAEWAKLFERCEWESIDFRALIPKIADQADCGCYCDPPWIEAGRNYLHSFTEQDHCDLALLLQRFEKTTIVVRYGRDRLLEDLYPREQWHWWSSVSRGQANNDVDEVWLVKNPRGSNG